MPYWIRGRHILFYDRLTFITGTIYTNPYCGKMYASSFQRKDLRKDDSHYIVNSHLRPWQKIMQYLSHIHKTKMHKWNSQISAHRDHIYIYMSII